MLVVGSVGFALRLALIHGAEGVLFTNEGEERLVANLTKGHGRHEGLPSG